MFTYIPSLRRDSLLQFLYASSTTSCLSPVPIACLCLSLISHIFILTTLLSLPSICFTRPFLHLYSDPTFDSLRSCQILILGREAILTPDGDGLMSIYGLCTLPFHFTCLTELSKANMLFAQISRVLSWIARSFPYPPKSFGQFAVIEPRHSTPSCITWSEQVNARKCASQLRWTRRSHIGEEEKKSCCASVHV